MITNNYQAASPVALECVLYWTVSIFNSSEVDKNWNEYTMEKSTNLSSEALDSASNPKQGVNIIIEPEDCWINNTYYENHYEITDLDGNPECINFVDPLAHVGLRN
jgi:hypothetical protein